MMSVAINKLMFACFASNELALARERVLSLWLSLGPGYVDSLTPSL